MKYTINNISNICLKIILIINIFLVIILAILVITKKGVIQDKIKNTPIINPIFYKIK